MLRAVTYDDENLKKIWAGYVTAEHWTVFFPADGGRPIVLPNNAVIDDILVDSRVEYKTGGSDEQANVSEESRTFWVGDSDDELLVPA